MKDLHIGDFNYYLEIRSRDIDHINITINENYNSAILDLNAEDVIVLKSWLESWLIERQE